LFHCENFLYKKYRIPSSYVYQDKVCVERININLLTCWEIRLVLGSFNITIALFCRIRVCTLASRELTNVAVNCCSQQTWIRHYSAGEITFAWLNRHLAASDHHRLWPERQPYPGVLLAFRIPCLLVSSCGASCLEDSSGGHSTSFRAATFRIAGRVSRWRICGGDASGPSHRQHDPFAWPNHEGLTPWRRQNSLRLPPEHLSALRRTKVCWPEQFPVIVNFVRCLFYYVQTPNTHLNIHNLNTFINLITWITS
jgi:hypothetical protein